MTEKLKNGVPVHQANPAEFVAQKSGLETNLPATPAEGDENQVFFVRSNDKEEMPLGEAMPAVMDAARPPGSPRSLDGQPRRPGSGQLLRPTFSRQNGPRMAEDVISDASAVARGRGARAGGCI